MVAAIAAGVRLFLQPGSPAEQQIIARLEGDAPTLLVLDNCEHLVEPLVPLVVRLLAACRSVTVLATSREPLDLPAEQVWRVESLSAPVLGQRVVLNRLGAYDAVILFVVRVR
jgi:predicted ATPase